MLVGLSKLARHCWLEAKLARHCWLEDNVDFLCHPAVSLESISFPPVDENPFNRGLDRTPAGGRMLSACGERGTTQKRDLGRCNNARMVSTEQLQVSCDKSGRERNTFATRSLYTHNAGERHQALQGGGGGAEEQVLQDHPGGDGLLLVRLHGLPARPHSGHGAGGETDAYDRLTLRAGMFATLATSIVAHCCGRYPSWALSWRRDPRYAVGTHAAEQPCMCYALVDPKVPLLGGQVVRL